MIREAEGKRVGLRGGGGGGERGRSLEWKWGRPV